MTRATFAENSFAMHQANMIRLAMLQLSAAGRRVIRFSGGKQPLIEIDSRVDGHELSFAERNGRTIGSCTIHGVLVFWTVCEEILVDD